MELGVDAEILELPAPVGVGIAQALDIDAARYALLDSCPDELRSKKLKRECQIDLPHGDFANCSASVTEPVSIS